MCSSRTHSHLIVTLCVAFACTPFCVADTPPASPPPAPTAHPAGSNELLTGDEVHKLVDAGQYQDALRAVIRILNLSGPAAAPYDRHDMLMVKAECQLQIRQPSMAIGTLDVVKKEALTAQKPDDVLKAAAFAGLIQKSPNGFYTPKTAAIKTPIKIADRTTRKSAYDALYADELALFTPKQTAADNGQSLPPFLAAAKLADALRPAEYGSTGSTKQTDEAIKDLADHALKLITSTLDDLSTKTDQISEAANRVITEQVTVAGNGGRMYQSQQTRRQGLTGTDAQDLHDIDATCKKIPQATSELARAFSTQADQFKAADNKAQEVSKKAENTLNADYLSP